MSAMAGPAWSAPPPGCLNGGEGGGAFGKKSPADWTESMQTLTITHLCGEGYEEEEDRQKVKSHCHVQNI